MEPKRITFFIVLLYLAYLFYIGFGIFWFYIGFASDRHFNYTAFAMVLVYGIQMYFRRKLVNLVLGIISLFFSIWMLMEVINDYNLFAKGVSLDDGGRLLLSLSVVSMIMSGILIFSYLHLNKERMKKEV